MSEKRIRLNFSGGSLGSSVRSVMVDATLLDIPELPDIKIYFHRAIEMIANDDWNYSGGFNITEESTGMLFSPKKFGNKKQALERISVMIRLMGKDKIIQTIQNQKRFLKL